MAICKKCGKTFEPAKTSGARGPKFLYCGDYKLRTGCSYLKRAEGRTDSTPEKRKLYRQRTAEHIKKRQRVYYLVNKQRIIASCRSWRERNRDRSNRSKLMYRDRRRASGSFSLDEWYALQAVFAYTCFGCGFKKPLTVDHKVPIAVGGTNQLDNIQPLCITCNQRKQKRTMFPAQRLSDRLFHLVEQGKIVMDFR